MAVTKETLVQQVVAANPDLSLREAEEYVTFVFKRIVEKLSRREWVYIHRFGRFEIQHKKPRVGRNPSTGEKLPLKARTIAVFRPSPCLKKKLNPER